MKLIGLTGGIGMGKSTAAQLLRERGVAQVDTAFIDNLLLPFGLTVDETTPAVLQMERLPDGSLLPEIQGQAGRKCLIQASTNLTSSATIATEVASNVVIHFTDSDAGSYPVRFYHAIAQVPLVHQHTVEYW